MRIFKLTKNGEVISTGETPGNAMSKVLDQLEFECATQFASGKFYTYVDANGDVWKMSTGVS